LLVSRPACAAALSAAPRFRFVATLDTLAGIHCDRVKRFVHIDFIYFWEITMAKPGRKVKKANHGARPACSRPRKNRRHKVKT
jgi:hypothetical protein